ncbi:MAG: YdcF family protein [Granulosicoccaceae bacterium]
MTDILVDPLVWMAAALLIAIISAAFLKHCARCAVLLTVLLLLLCGLASPLFANRWLGTLEDQYPSAACTEEAQEIPTVALAGGFHGGYSNLGLAQRLSNASKNRALAAAAMVPEGGTLILSGGSIRPERPKEANAMAEFIGPLLAPNVQLNLEVDSRDTRTSAIAVGQMMDSLGLARDVVLVSSAAHMPRAAAVFKAQGFELCAHSVDPLQATVDAWTAALPRVTAIQKTNQAIHEWVGILFYRQQGWI